VKVLRHFCVAIIFGVLFFGFQGALKKNLSLEPLLKLARFKDGIINFQNIFKKFEKLAATAVFTAAKKVVQKRQKFS
jgi:hypothetical protein